ncbi:MAG TPA: DUF971 domain-containing protein [Anaerolineales bacterium]|nr:DUF971 domain-containing protein [Anaerolineales bacterium]
MRTDPNGPKPVDISANRQEAQMKIKWNTGEESVFSFDLLRNSCPCAECRGGHANMKPEPDDSMFVIPLMDSKTTQLTEIKPVGGYAVAFHWADGHSAGIYNWHYLYVLHQKNAAKGDGEE